MGSAVIIAQTIEGITDCKTMVGIRLPAESDELAEYVTGAVEVEEQEGEQ